MPFQDPLSSRITALVSARFDTQPDREGLSDSELDAAERALGTSFPQSYRVFLRYFGAQPRVLTRFYGLPRHQSWGDIVLMNSLDASFPPHRFVKFAAEAHLEFYLDTARMDDRGECPVVLRVDWHVVDVARDFVEFLCLIETELDEWLIASEQIEDALVAHSSEAQTWAP